MIRFITDSTCEAPPEFLAHPSVSVVPMSVVFGQRALRDGVDITREQFWELLPKSEVLPTTSQATPGDFTGLFRDFAAAGDEVITLVISRKLSGTYDSAVIAKETVPGVAVDIINSDSTSVGLGLMLGEGLAMAADGASRAEIVEKLNSMRERVHVLFTLDTLEYLQRGGRIGRAQSMVGTLLNLKPILALSEGEVVPVGRVRNKRKAIDRMLELLAERVSARGPHVHLAVTHGNSRAGGEKVAGSLTELFSSQQVFISDLGPVLGTHLGPGTIGASVYAAD